MILVQCAWKVTSSANTINVEGLPWERLQTMHLNPTDLSVPYVRTDYKSIVLFCITLLSDTLPS